MRRWSRPQQLYLAVLGILGVSSGAAVLSVQHIRSGSSLVLLYGIAIAYALAIYFGVKIERGPTVGSPVIITVADAPVVFALIVAGPAGLLPLLGASIGARYLQRRWEQPLGYFFNLTHLSMGYCIWLAVDRATRTPGVIPFSGLSGTALLIGLIVCYPLWDVFTSSLLVSMGSKQPILQVCRQTITPTAWIIGIPVALGALGGIAFTIDPWLIAPTIVPLFLAQRAIQAVARWLEESAKTRQLADELAILNRDLETRVAERTAELEQALHAKDDFVGIVAHELRTPLTSIVGSLGILTDVALTTLPPRTQRMLEVAHTNSERLARLINDILDIQKLEADRMLFHLQLVDIADLVAQAIEANRGYALTFGVTLRLGRGPSECWVLADSDRLIQVLTNLISNACKFSPPQGQVDLTIDIIEEIVRVAVIDRGPGIPQSFHARIFDKFAQADTAANRQKGGTGLGLSIAKAVIEQLGGAIGFTTTQGNGTTFFIDLPIHQGPTEIEYMMPLHPMSSAEQARRLV